MKMILLIAALGSASVTDKIWDNFRNTAASCFHIGWTLHDMKINPKAYIPDTYNKAKGKAEAACFLEGK